jgi:hypothetical protein
MLRFVFFVVRKLKLNFARPSCSQRPRVLEQVSEKKVIFGRAHKRTPASRAPLTDDFAHLKGAIWFDGRISPVRPQQLKRAELQKHALFMNQFRTRVRLHA